MLFRFKTMKKIWTFETAGLWVNQCHPSKGHTKYYAALCLLCLVVESELVYLSCNTQNVLICNKSRF